ncbi:TPR-like protein [Mycena floridula]|nr:TPR-like protein [Mycena floridula]
MSLVKAKLKSARDALSKKDYAGARDSSLKVLEYEPDNYNANVFLGLADLELGDLQNSEQAYRKAVDSNPDQSLAWQGLAKFYERVENWEKYAETLQKLIQLSSSDPVKCAESVQKFIQLRREHGTRPQLVDSLSMLLPDSSFYSILSTLPEPDPTNPTSTTTYQIQVLIHNTLLVLEEVVQITEADEAAFIKSEVQKRRTRIGAPGLEQLQKDVGLEVWSTSKLPHFYNEILNHPNTSDELRRLTDAKLLRLKHDHLKALPASSDKSKISAELDALVNGTIILEIPDELAWMLFIEQKNCDTVDGYDTVLLQKFMALFPDLPLVALLKGYFIYMAISVELDEEDEDEKLAEEPEVGLDMILESYPLVRDSILATRIMAQVHLLEVDYSNTIIAAENGLKILAKSEAIRGRRLPRVRMGFKSVMATALVHLFPPKHHARAMKIVEEVLSQLPDHVPCLMAHGYILRDAQNWAEAAEAFAKISALLPEDHEDGLRAKEEQAWCLCQGADVEGGIRQLNEVLKTLEELGDRDHDCSRCLWRLGKCLWDTGLDKQEEAYRYFIASLKQDSVYAPAFASLGVYYSEYALDPIRASKCFQKAFELDPREADAARRLAEGFAEEREWDLVEVVARRTIEGEGGLDAGLKDSNENMGARYEPTNGWAWKAVGIVELIRHNYPPAIQSFQIALRAEPDDQLTWLRLGEAYGGAGRHVAALKALERARELKSDDWMCAYFTGDVYRQMGQYQQAIDALQSILVLRPSEIVVLSSLAQTYLDLGQTELRDGYVARAEESFAEAIQLTLTAMHDNPGFRGAVWKTAADAIFLLSSRSTFVAQRKVHNVLAQITKLLAPEPSDRLAGIVSLKPLDVETCDGSTAMKIALAAYDHRISLGSSDSEVVASAWFDLGVALRLWAIKQPNNEDRQKADKKAIDCLTESVRSDPETPLYWLTLGDAYFVSDAKVAQHAYVRALEIDNKSAIAWTNLGLLYLHSHDLELANEALYRAQTLDPDYTLAWVGQGLVATANGHEHDAKTLIEHATTLTIVLPEADLQFSASVFNRVKQSSQPFAEALLPAFSVLERYSKLRPNDACGLHLYGLVCEALGLLDRAVELITRSITILEAAYEECEDENIEKQFTIAHSNMARIQLALEAYPDAIQSFESALGLLPDNSDPPNNVLRTHAQFGIGLATFKLGDLERALTLLQAAVESASGDSIMAGQVTVLLAKTLWATGAEDLRETAKTQLLECITEDSENLVAINTLAAMGILTEDDSLIDAALSEILALPLERRHQLDPKRDVGYLLMQHHLGQEDLGKALSVAQSALFAEPGRLEGRKDLAILTLQMGETGPVLPILKGSSTIGIEGDRQTLALLAVAEATSGSHGGLRYAAKAIMVTPWELKNWQTLAFVRSCSL